MLACTALDIDAEGRETTTIEGISHGNTMHQVQAAFVKHDAMQCRFCTPGMVMSSAAAICAAAEPSPRYLLRRSRSHHNAGRQRIWFLPADTIE